MDYVDATLVKLADPASRAALFDTLALENLLGAAYDAPALNLSGPFSAVFDEVQIGLSASGVARVEGSWAVVGSAQRTEASFQIAGLAINPAIRVDALWRGAIVARTSSADAPIKSVTVDWPNLRAIDAEIIAALGALPTDPVALESERRTRLQARIAASFDQPNFVTAERVDSWLSGLGASSASDFVENHAGDAFGAHTKVVFAAPQETHSSPQPLPVSIALLIRDVGFSLAQLLWESRLVRERLEPAGIQRARSGPRPRTPIVIGWLVPPEVFDDGDWPGATTGMTTAQQREARRTIAGSWLAREGIGLAMTP